MSVCLNDFGTTTEQSREMFTAQHYVILMLKRRGYAVDPLPWHESYEDFVRLWATATTYTAFTIVGKHPTKGSIIVFWPFEEKLRIISIREIMEMCATKKYNHVIIVYFGMITSFAKQQLVIIRSNMGQKTTEKDRADAAPSVRVETFNIRCFQYDLLQHKYVPYQKILEDAEKAQLLRCYRAKASQLPKIFATDPVAEYLGALPGQVVESLRPSPEGFFYRHWRICIRGNILK